MSRHQDNNDLQFFDFMKAVGAIIVFFGHVLVNNTHIYKITPIVWSVTIGSGHITNDAFFFISGWLSVKAFESSIRPLTKEN